MRPSPGQIGGMIRYAHLAECIDRWSISPKMHGVLSISIGLVLRPGAEHSTSCAQYLATGRAPGRTQLPPTDSTRFCPWLCWIPRRSSGGIRLLLSGEYVGPLWVGRVGYLEGISSTDLAGTRQ